MSRKLVHLQVHALPVEEYISFPESIQNRSVRGAVHFRTGTVLVTEDELKHIESSPELSRLQGRYTVISRDVAQEDAPEGLEPAPSTAVAPESTPDVNAAPGVQVVNPLAPAGGGKTKYRPQ